MAVENRLREVLKVRKITQTGLAELVGVSKQTMSAIINGKTDPSLELAIKISKEVREPLDKLFFIKDNDSYNSFMEMLIGAKQFKRLHDSGSLDEIEYQVWVEKLIDEYINEHGLQNFSYYIRVISETEMFKEHVKKLEVDP